jgi:hypothetical protein
MLMSSALVLTLLFPTVVFAEAIVGSGSAPPSATDRFATVSFMLGNLYPDIDQTPGLKPAPGQTAATPYATTFNNQSMLFFQLEGDSFLWSKYGSAGVGFSAGYGERYAQASFATGGVAPVKTGLQLLPLKALVLYRMDYAQKRWNVPFVPYGKLGLIWEPWWATTGGSVDYYTSQSGVVTRGAGARWGWGWTAGLAFMLDVIEPRVAKDAQTDTGIRHSYLFVEYDADLVQGFGSQGIDLSNRRWMFGLAFDF